MRRVLVIGLMNFAASAHAAGSCLVLTRPVPRLAAITASGVEHLPCPDAVQHVLYDSHAHVVRASADFAVGTTIRDVPAERLALATRGEPVMIVEKTGGIKITRPATLIADAVGGMPAMARTSDDVRVYGELQL